MDESNSQPTRCPCGFFGSQQTLGLCSKCFREREQNRNQAAADVPRQSVSSDLARQVMASSSGSGSDASRQSNGGGSSDAQNKKSDHSRLSLAIDSPSSSSSSTDQASGNSRLQPSTSQQLKSDSGSDDKPPSDTAKKTCSCTDETTEKRLAQKRKHSDATEGTPSDDAAANAQVKRRRVADPNSHCHMCNCRLELAVQAIGKCKCGCVFCLLHRLPEQHNCTYDHKEDGRREARSKMVPARKHVGTTLKRLDSDS